MSIAFVFPGQGSQAVGMGQALHDSFAAAKNIFAEIDDALSQDLSKLMFDGPEDQLTLTENAQPALMAVSLAALRVLETETDLSLAADAKYVAGHSLGEYSALAAAGAISVANTARLLKIRGQAMQAAVPVGAGAMAAVLGLDLGVVEKIAAEAAQSDVCAVANDNAPGQVVLSGSSAAIDRAIDLAKSEGARRSIKLAVSAPFHCDLMQPAAAVMSQALASTEMSAPAVPVIANVTAQPVTDPEAIAGLLVEQVTRRVRWRESIAAMAADGIDRFIELGAGKVLSGLNKRIAGDATLQSVGTPEDLAAMQSGDSK